MLYNKQLNSIEALRAERLALKLNANKKIQNSVPKEKEDNDETYLAKQISFLSSKLLGDSKYAELVNTITQIALPFLLKEIATKNAKKLAIKASSEILFGYAKWKAISVIVKLIAEKVKEKRGSK